MDNFQTTFQFFLFPFVFTANFFQKLTTRFYDPNYQKCRFFFMKARQLNCTFQIAITQKYTVYFTRIIVRKCSN